MKMALTLLGYSLVLHCLYQVHSVEWCGGSASHDVVVGTNSSVRELDHSIEDLDHMLANCTTVHFISPTIVLPRTLHFKNLHNISFIGINNSTTIDCNDNYGIQFTNIVNLSVTNLTFLKCAEKYTMNIIHKGKHTYEYLSGIRIFNCSDVHFTEVTTGHSMGTGIIVFSTAGNNLFHKCIFEFNGKEATIGGSGLSLEISNYNDSYQDLVGSVYTIDNCTFKGNSGFEDASIDASPIGRGGGLHVIVRYSSSNNTISVNACHFFNNSAKFGGALYTFFFDSSANNKVAVSNSTFVKNMSPKGYGGAYNAGFYSASQHGGTNNSIFIISCNFTGNNAVVGGGLAFTSTRSDYMAANEIKCQNSSWTNNSAHYGAAITLLPDHWSLPTIGMLPNPHFEDCTLKNNSILDVKFTGHLKLREPFHQSTLGSGCLYVSSYNVLFSGSLLVEHNNGSAIFGSSCSLKFSNGTSASFHGNTGYVGGAMHLAGYSTMHISENTTFSFHNNTALTDGGAIFHYSADIIEHAYSYNCFISKNNNSDKDTISFEFAGNKAGAGNGDSGHGNSIYATSLLPCMRQYNHSFNNLGNFAFHDSQIGNEVVSEVTSFSTEAYNFSEVYVPIIPGKYTRLTFEGYDDALQKRSAVYIVTVQNHHNGTVVWGNASSFAINNTVRLLGKPGEEATVSLSTLTKHKTILSFRVKLTPCPPGYILSELENRGMGCICSADTDTVYTGIHSCDALHFQAKRGRGFWAGYNPSISINDDHSFISGYCPTGYCKYIDDERLPGDASPEILNENVCEKHRAGVLCSKCTHNTTAYYHSHAFICGKEDLCHLGWLFYLTSEILPATILYLAIIMMNVSFTSHPLNGLVLYAQMIEFFHITVNSRLKLSGATDIMYQLIRLLYGFFNLRFFYANKLSFCLYRKAKPLDLLIFQYATAFYSLFLVLFILLVFRVCNLRPIKLFFRCRVRSIQTSMIHGLSAFLVLCFANCAHVSTSVLSFGLLRGKGEKVIKTVVYIYGKYDWLSWDHFKYVIPSVLIGIVIVVIPLVILLSYPLCFKCLALLKLQEAKCTMIFSKFIDKIKPFLDSFQGCYKDSCRYFAGLHFLYRIIILLNYSLNLTAYFYLTLELQLILMLLAHAIVQPYKEKLHNITDLLLFANMAVVNGISMFNYTQSFDSQLYIKNHNVFLAIQLVLIATPLICALLYYSCLATKAVVKCLKSKSDEQEDDDLLNYCEILPSRQETIPIKFGSHTTYKTLQDS